MLGVGLKPDEEAFLSSCCSVTNSKTMSSKASSADEAFRQGDASAFRGIDQCPHHDNRQAETYEDHDAGNASWHEKTQDQTQERENRAHTPQLYFLLSAGLQDDAVPSGRSHGRMLPLIKGRKSL